MSGDKQGVDTQTHRGVRGHSTTFLTTLATHTFLTYVFVLGHALKTG